MTVAKLNHLLYIILTTHHMIIVELDMNYVVGATNPGSVAQTVHMHENKIEAPAQVRVQEPKKFEGPTCRSEGPRTSQESRISSREKPPLPGRQSRQEARPPADADNRGAPVGPARAHGGKTTSPTTQA